MKSNNFYIIQHNNNDFNHEQEFQTVANELFLLRKSDLISDLNIAKAVSSLDDSSRKSTNPLRQGLPLTSRNLFIDIVKHGLSHNKELVYTILCLTTDTRSIFDKSTVIATAKLLISISSRFSSNANSTFAKLQGVVLQACGLNDVGLQALATQGESVQVRSLLNTRTNLAVKDEENVK